MSGTLGIHNVCALAMVAAGAVFGQSAFPLESLRITGNQRIPVKQIIAASGLKIHAKVTKADFDDARARLMATGAFENVGYIFKPSAGNAGYDATFEVVEIDQLYAYRFEDLPVPADQLRETLRKVSPFFSDQIPVGNQILDKYVAAIQAQVGPKIKVTAQLNSDLPGKTMVVFRPNTPLDRVAEVKFVGNHVLPSAPLVEAFAGVAAGVAYREPVMRALLDSSVRPLYDARGRLRVSFPKIETRPSLFTEGVTVIVTVDEGPSYSLGDVQLTGIAAADLAEMQKAADLKAKDLADFDQVKAGMNRVLAKYRDRGFMSAAGKISRQVDDQNRTVNVTIAIEKGAIFTMGKLEILGLDSSSAPVIRKMWALKPGATFHAAYPDEFLDDIRKKQLFDNLGQTRSETSVDEKSHTADVKLFFIPAPSDTPRK